MAVYTGVPSSAVSYKYVCEPCRAALGLLAESSYLNRIKREAGGFSKSGRPSPSKAVRQENEMTLASRG